MTQTTTADCIEWLERVEKFQGVDPLTVKHFASAIRARLQNVQKMEKEVERLDTRLTEIESDAEDHRYD